MDVGGRSLQDCLRAMSPLGIERGLDDKRGGMVEASEEEVPVVGSVEG